MATLPLELREVKGAQELFDWFGHWPTFHDAEVIEVRLHRTLQSCITVHTWQMADRVNEQGVYEQIKHVVIDFLLEEIEGMNVEGFNHQNVISELGVRKTSAGFVLDFGPCYGFSGTIQAARLSLRITPGKPV